MNSPPDRSLPPDFVAGAAVWLRRLRVMIFKELVQLLRDWPLMLFLVYTFTVNVYLAGSEGGIELKQGRVFVHDHDHSAASRELWYRFQPPYFRRAGAIDDPRQGIRLLDQGAATAIVDIPPRFQHSLLAGEVTNVQLQIDATMTVQGYLAASYAEQIAGRYAVEVAALRPDVPSSLPAIENEHRLWFNATENDAWYASISELLMTITVFAVLLPAAALAREKERGTIEQLMVSPLTPVQIIAPKVLAMTGVILLGTALSLVTILQGCFGVPVRGSLALFFAVTTLYVTTTTGLGIVAGTIARNMAQVGMLVVFIVLPTVILSDLMTPPEGQPAWRNALTQLVPLHHYLQITLDILLKGAGVTLLWPRIAGLAALGGVVFWFGRWCFCRL
jgi:ABC-2 type transport system permease protein